MTTVHYLIFLACLTFLDIAVLYTYFFLKETDFNETIRNEYFSLSLKKAYFIQALFLLIQCRAASDDFLVRPRWN